jgi:hypothetical protein
MLSAHVTEEETEAGGGDVPKVKKPTSEKAGVGTLVAGPQSSTQGHLCLCSPRCVTQGEGKLLRLCFLLWN